MRGLYHNEKNNNNTTTFNKYRIFSGLCDKNIGRKIEMKKLFVLFALVMIIFAACDSYPQSVTIRTTYNTPASADSCYLLLWKGTDTNQNPLFEDGSYDLLNLSTLSVYKVPIGASKVFNFTLPADGKTFKLALVPFDVNFSAPLTVSAFYTLPKPPAKAEIINVEIF